MSSPSQEDGAIVAAVLAGETQRFDELVGRYRGPLMRVAISRLGCHDGADDVVQETFLCAFKSLSSYDSRFSFRTWLWTILLNQCRQTYHKRMRRRTVLGEAGAASPAAAAGLLSDEPNPAHALENQEQSALLHAMLDQLPLVQGDALRLRFFGGLKFREIADAMGCSLSTAKNRVRWGLTRMSDLLRTADQTSGSASVRGDGDEL